ncbi:NUDIX hydrolase [Saccharophagus degradans]|uniref:CoA pyrophosphatase n=1 Tax=Saccharophagus degradans TaxID=86304 RepID=A0AAW7X5T7_9GAMM|nr:CoA pyrophosphatase [Saccharophagus degradans]MDO6422909.1 CoA pyrophosphatase [Saccharophagus degradans]MDO6607054.1 CoA pyrophosphatase [Saccharophagus degradans]WGO97345.1 CoA pyrophosphatase [Saccharophagus degradans]
MMVSELINQAAVMVLLSEGPSGERVLLTRRAEHLNQHAGEIALPGGKWEPADPDLLTTALRETHEEVGIPPWKVEVLGTLPAAYTRRGVKVTPYIGRVAHDVELVANLEELDEMFWIPIEFLKQDKRKRTDRYQHLGKVFWAPAYVYEQHLVWGFTARVLVELLRVHYGVVLQAPEGAC